MASPSTNVTLKLRGGTGGSTGDTGGGISDFDHGLQSHSPLRGQRSANVIGESLEESQIKLKRQSNGGLFSGVQGLGVKAQISESIHAYSHLWEMLLQKLVQFMDNSPSENAILCQCILQLFEIPGQDKLIVKTTKRTVRKKQQEQKPQLELIPLELLQWWLYSLQFVEKAPQKLSKR